MQPLADSLLYDDLDLIQPLADSSTLAVYDCQRRGLWVRDVSIVCAVPLQRCLSMLALILRLFHCGLWQVCLLQPLAD